MTLMTRLTHNDNYWNVPSGHPWQLDDQGNADLPHEDQYGFSHEEWLFNTRYHIGGFQYGYIRGLRDYPGCDSYGILDRVYLYSVQGEQASVFYIGYITEVQLLGPDWPTQLRDVADIYEGHEQMLFQEIREAGGDPGALDHQGLVPVIRFRMNNVFLAEAPVLLPDFPLDQYGGFDAYPVTPELEQLFK